MRRVRKLDYEAGIWATFSKWTLFFQLPVGQKKGGGGGYGGCAWWLAGAVAVEVSLNGVCAAVSVPVSVSVPQRTRSVDLRVAVRSDGATTTRNDKKHQRHVTRRVD
jgi:hypothetical protein